MGFFVYLPESGETESGGPEFPSVDVPDVGGGLVVLVSSLPMPASSPPPQPSIPKPITKIKIHPNFMLSSSISKQTGRHQAHRFAMLLFNLSAVLDVRTPKIRSRRCASHEEKSCWNSSRTVLRPGVLFSVGSDRRQLGSHSVPLHM